MAAKKGLTGRERRNFFRLQDNVYIEYRQASEAEVKKELKGQERSTPKADDASYQLDALSRQIAPLLGELKAASPGPSQLFELINRKIDLVASMVFFDHFVNSSEGNTQMATSTVDISEGGASFDSPVAFKMRSHLYIRLVIVGFRYGLETYGVVAHCGEVASPDNAAVKYRIGVEFPHLSEFDRKQLTRYIFDRQRELIRNKRHDEQ